MSRYSTPVVILRIKILRKFSSRGCAFFLNLNYNADRNRDGAREIGTWPIAIRCQPPGHDVTASSSLSQSNMQPRCNPRCRIWYAIPTVNMVTGQSDRCRSRSILFGSGDFELYGEINFPAGRRLSYYVITRLMGEVPSSVRARDRRRGGFFYPRVNLNGIKFISSLLRRLAFRTGCVRVHLQKIRVWKHESSLEYINFWIDFTLEKIWLLGTYIRGGFIEIKFFNIFFRTVCFSRTIGRLACGQFKS